MDSNWTFLMKYQKISLRFLNINRNKYKIYGTPVSPGFERVKKINLLHLCRWCFPGSFINFSEAANGGALIKKLFLKDNFAIFTRNLQACNFIKKRLQRFSSKYCEILKTTYFEEHLITAASDFLKQLQNSSEQLLLYWLLV